MIRKNAKRRRSGFTLVEVAISASLLSALFYMCLSGYISSVRGSASGNAQLDAMVNNAKALTTMNMELQEASVREETVEIYQVDPDTGVIVSSPFDPASIPAPDTVYPSDAQVGDDSFALRFMTVGDFTTVGDTVTVEEAGPFLYRLGTGADTDFPRDQLIRVDESGTVPPRVLCKGVEQIVFQRDSRGGAILITLRTHGRNAVTGTEIETRQVLTITPKNDFSANLSNFDLNGQEF